MIKLNPKDVEALAQEARSHGIELTEVRTPEINLREVSERDIESMYTKMSFKYILEPYCRESAIVLNVLKNLKGTF